MYRTIQITNNRIYSWTQGPIATNMGGEPGITIVPNLLVTGINAPSIWWRKRLSANLQRFLATLWPWIFAITLINGVFLVIGSVILVYFFDLNNPDLFTNSFFFAVVSLFLTIFTGVVYDIQRD